MTNVNKNIPEYYKDLFLKPLRSKTDFVRIVLYSARTLMINDEINMKMACGKIRLVIDKMSRLFFNGPSKSYSISFPLFLEFQTEGGLYFRTHHGTEITYELISNSISIIDNENFCRHPFPSVFCFNDSVDLDGLQLIEELIMAEPGYVRYDRDPTNEQGKIHPLIHLDVNYSSYGTFKLGLDYQLQVEEFEDLLNITTECKYIR